MKVHHVEHRTEIEAAPEDRVGCIERVDQSLERQGEQRIRRPLPFGQAKPLKQGERTLPAIGGTLRSDLLAAHRGGRMEQSVGFGHGHQRCDFRPTTRLSEDHYAPGIAAERGNVIAHPFERADKIELPRIAAVPEALAQRLQPAVAEQVEPMIDRHHHRIGLRGKMRPPSERIGNRTPIVGPAVEIDHDRTACGRMRIGRPDVEEQTVLAHPRRHRIALRAQRPEFGRPGGLLRQALAPRRGEPGCARIADAEKGLRPAIAEAAIAECLRVARSSLQVRRCHECGATEAAAEHRPAREAASAGHRPPRVRKHPVPRGLPRSYRPAPRAS